MADKVYARVARDGYTYKGQGIPTGTVVESSAAQLEDAKRIEPPYLVPATATEAKEAEPVVLAEIVAPGEPNIEAAAAKSSKKG